MVYAEVKQAVLSMDTYSHILERNYLESRWLKHKFSSTLDSRLIFNAVVPVRSTIMQLELSSKRNICYVCGVHHLKGHVGDNATNPFGTDQRS